MNKCVQLKMLAGKWRTVRSDATSRLARNKAGSPVDGGGWTAHDKSVGERQVHHINESIHKSYGGL